MLEMVKITIPSSNADIISSTGPNSGTITRWYAAITSKNIEPTQKIHIKNQEQTLVG